MLHLILIHLKLNTQIHPILSMSAESLFYWPTLSTFLHVHKTQHLPLISKHIGHISLILLNLDFHLKPNKKSLYDYDYLTTDMINL